MKVCLLQPFCTPYRMGLFNELNRQLGGKMTVLYFFGGKKSHNWIYQRNVEFRERQLKSSMRQIDSYYRQARLSFMSLIWALLKERPSVVICQETGPGRLVRLAQLFMRFKMVCWTEENEISLCGSRPKIWFMRWMDRGFSSYVVPGRLSEGYVRRIRNYTGPVRFAPNTIDRIRFSNTQEEVLSKFMQGEIRLLFSGNLIARKGFDTLLDVFERLAETEGLPDYRLDIIGDGPVEKRPVKRVHYQGYLSQDECARFMKQAHVFVLPSLWDCNPLTATEAVTAGCVTVLSDGVGNYPEYTDGNGFVFERGNAEALYDALLMVLRMSRADLLEMAKKSLLIASEVSHENSARVFVQAIEDCTQKK